MRLRLRVRHGRAFDLVSSPGLAGAVRISAWLWSAAPMWRAAARAALERVASGRLRRLPFTLRFWDGSTLPGESPTPVTVAAQPAGAHVPAARAEPGRARARVGDGNARRRGRHREAARRARYVSRGRAVDRRPGEARVGGGPRRAVGAAPARPAPVDRGRPRGRRHSLGRDRTAVRHHYDVSNDFYRLVLGPSLTYSCAYFETGEETLETAQERKHELICRKLRLAPGERLLDIGCGWGSLLLHAAEHHGVRGVGVTLSEQQAELARERVREAGLSDASRSASPTTASWATARSTRSRASACMSTSGARELGRYASSVSRLLRPGGLFLNHGIARLASEPARARHIHQPLHLSRRRAAPGHRDPVRDAGRRARGAGRRVAARALPADAAALAREPGGRPGSRDRDRRRRARARVVAVHDRSAVGFEDGDISVYQVLASRLGGAHHLPLDRAELVAV